MIFDTPEPASVEKVGELGSAFWGFDWSVEWAEAN